jgi:hypothetical protein
MEKIALTVISKKLLSQSRPQEFPFLSLISSPILALFHMGDIWHKCKNIFLPNTATSRAQITSSRVKAS